MNTGVDAHAHVAQTHGNVWDRAGFLAAHAARGHAGVVQALRELAGEPEPELLRNELLAVMRKDITDLKLDERKIRAAAGMR